MRAKLALLLKHSKYDIIDLFDNPVGCLTSLAKYCVFCLFYMEVVLKLKFPNNSNIYKLGDDHMPLISSFYGILIYMFKEKNSPHKMPHVHALFSGEKMSISSDGEILAGKLPRKQQKIVEAWVALREDEIKASWIALNENSEVIKIKGLEV